MSIYADREAMLALWVDIQLYKTGLSQDDTGNLIELLRLVCAEHINTHKSNYQK